MLGSNESMLLISLANRFKIRPLGLLLKKAILARVIPRKIMSCKLIDIRKHIPNDENERPTTQTVPSTMMLV